MGEGFSMFFVSWAKTSAFCPFLTQLQSQTQVCYVYIYIYVLLQEDVNHLELVMSYKLGDIHHRKLRQESKYPFLIAGDEDRLR